MTNPPNPTGDTRQYQPKLAILLTITAMVIFGIMDGFTKYLGQSYHPLQIIWMRFCVFTSVAILISFRHQGPLSLLKATHKWRHLARGLLFVIEILIAAYSFSILPLAIAQTMILTFPLFISLLSGVLLKEYVGPHRRAAIIAGFFGVLIILRPGFDDFNPNLLIGLFCGFLFASYNLATRDLSRFSSSPSMLLSAALIAWLVSTPLVGLVWRTPNSTDLLIMLTLGGFSLIGHYALIISLSLAPTPLLQPFNYFLLVTGLLVGYFGFGEILDAMSLFGAALIVASGLYTFWRESKRLKPQ